MSNDTAISLNKIFSALANDNRRGMIHVLAQRPATHTQLAEPFELSLPAAHKHIKVLEQAGLVRTKKSGRRKFVALNPDTLGLAKDWLSVYQTHWGSRHETLENYVANLPE